jgi:hypothetical protein
MEALGGEDVQLLLTHDLGTRWGEWSASRLARALPPGKGPIPLRTHWTGGWVGPRISLGTEARGKTCGLCQGSNLDSPVVQSVVRHYTY